MLRAEDIGYEDRNSVLQCLLNFSHMRPPFARPLGLLQNRHQYSGVRWENQLQRTSQRGRAGVVGGGLNGKGQVASKSRRPR